MNDTSAPPPGVPGTPAPEHDPLGRAFRRVDARAKVSGETLFADDLSFPRMVWMKLTRSTRAHAELERIDTGAARTMPGVLAVLTGADLPRPYGILPVSQDEHALAHGRVRHVGEAVAAVAALSEDEAHAAALAVQVTYRPLEVIDGIETALATPEPRLHEYADEGNVHKKVALRFGDVEGGFAGADEVFDDVFFYEGNTHLALEQHAAVAVPEDDGRLTLYSSTQTPHYVHRALARVLELPPARIRVIACSNGGGFGGKTDPFGHEIAAARMALELGRPVKIVLTREEVFYCHRGRHPVLMRLRSGFSRDGRLTAQHLSTLLDGGAYGSYGVASTYYTGALQTTTYQLPAYRFEGARVFTNKPACGPKRGHGTPQPRFALEVQMDKAAERLGIDPAELRLRNLVAPGTVTANWLQLGTVGLGRCIEAVVEGSGWRARYGRLPPGRGLGLACGAYMCGAGLPIYWNQMPHSGVQLQLDRSGKVTVFCGAAEIGQGSDSVLAAIVAHELGVALEDIRLCVADTDLTPVDLGSYSSRVTVMMGHAALQAAGRARALLAGAVAQQFECPPERVMFAGGRVYDPARPGEAISFAEAVIAAEAREGTLGTTGSYTPPRSPGRYRGAGVGPSPSYSYTAMVIEVEADRETGIYAPRQVWVAHDIGRAINPVLALGQIEGGVYMGLGEAMMEGQTFRRLPRRLSGALVHHDPSMLEYKSPGFDEMPRMTSYLIRTDEPKGPLGAKEVGQGPLLPVMPALANALFDALGVRIDQVPIQPEHVVRALEAAAHGKPARFGPRRFPEFDYGEALVVPTPAEGGDGRAAGAAHGGTMKEREEALREKRSAALTTD